MAHVTFIHGIANKPDKDTLLRIWRDSLSKDEGVDLGAEGITSSMVYWADILYESPDKEVAEHESLESVIKKEDEEISMDWIDEAVNDEKAWSDSLATKLNFDAEAPEQNDDYEPPESGLESSNFEGIPLPWWLKRRLMKIFLRDVHHYLFNTEFSPRDGDTYMVQDEIRKRFVGAIKEGDANGSPHIVVSHSMGTVIAYDCLKRVADCPAVDCLMTIGSPLGLDEVQDKLQPGWSKDDGFPEEKLKQSDWVNVYDKLDPVAGFDPKIANDYQRNNQEIIQDINEQNHGKWRHNISKYLNGELLREAIVRQLGL